MDINILREQDERIKELEKKVRELIDKNHELYSLKAKELENIWEKENIKEEKFNEPFSPKNENDYEYSLIMNYFRSNKSGDKTNCLFFKSDKELHQRAKEMNVYALLKNFSEANGADKIEWHKNIPKFYIDKNCVGLYLAETYMYWPIPFVIYFISYEVAEEALRRYKTELEEVIK